MRPCRLASGPALYAQCTMPNACASAMYTNHRPGERCTPRRATRSRSHGPCGRSFELLAETAHLQLPSSR